jgi:hypothetical protein
MGKSLNLTLAVIKAVAAGIRDQWHPSPLLPQTGNDFDPADEAQLEDYIQDIPARLFLKEIAQAKAATVLSALVNLIGQQVSYFAIFNQCLQDVDLKISIGELVLSMIV